MREIAGIKLYTVSEAAKELEVTSQTVRAYVKTGKLKGERVGRPILITEASIKTLLSGSLDSNKRPVSDEEILERIKSLVATLKDETREKLLFYLSKDNQPQKSMIAE